MAKRNVRSGRVVIFQRDYDNWQLLQDEWGPAEHLPDHVLRKQLEEELLRQQTPIPRFADRKAVLQFFAAVAVCDRIAEESRIRIQAVLDYDEYTADIELAGVYLDVRCDDYLPALGKLLTQADRFWIEPGAKPSFTVFIRMLYFKDAYLCP